MSVNPKELLSFLDKGILICRVNVRAVVELAANLQDKLDALRVAYEAQKIDREAQVKDMVNRFLGWPVPKTFGPDCGISFDGRKDDEWNKNKTWPIGTNLLTAEEAKAMFEYCLRNPTLATKVEAEKEE